MANKRATIVVRGRVQGVGYRYFVTRKAERLGLRGYTRNESDGSVYTVAEGDFNSLEQLIGHMKTGPLNAEVKDCMVVWSEAAGEFEDFRIST